MKNKILIALLALFFFISCSEQLLREDEILQKRDAKETASPNLLLSSIIQKSSFLHQGLHQDELGITVQHIQESGYGFRNIYDQFRTPKNELYKITREIKLVQAAVDDMHEKGLTNHEGIFLIFKTSLWSMATDLYGDIYYTEGLRGQEGILFPEFDEQKDIYPALIQNLKDAVQLLSEGVDLVDNESDILYEGDKSRWIKFANSLRLRLLMRASKNLPGVEAEIAEVAALPLMEELADNASIDYMPSGGFSWPKGNANEGWQEGFLNNRPCKTLVDSLKALNDERLKVWCAPIQKPWTDVSSDNGKVEFVEQKGYTYEVEWEHIDRSNSEIANVAYLIQDSLTLHGGYPAASFNNLLKANGSYTIINTAWNLKISTFSRLLNENAHPLLKASILQADEVQFLLAEAAVKGYITGSAEDYYKKGVELALNRWEELLPSDYFDNPSAKFPANGTDDQKLAKIALQKWLGLFMMPVEAYADYRRTRLPDIDQNGDLPLGDYKLPLRFRYPQTELNNNAEKYQEAIGRLDQGDTEFSKMWLLQ
jgi:hypothetical protein